MNLNLSNQNLSVVKAQLKVQVALRVTLKAVKGVNLLHFAPKYRLVEIQTPVT